MPPNTETLDLLKTAQGTASQALIEDLLAKGITQATGLVAYDLRAPALSLVPVLTPLRNRIPRVNGLGGNAINWKGVTGINTSKTGVGVSEGNRGGVVSTATQNYLAAYKGIGLEDYVTFEADYAGQGFEDVKALAALNLLRATMIAEEQILLGGNTSTPLGTTPTPAVSTATAQPNGAIGTGVVVSVICVALTLEGAQRSTLAGGIPQAITKTNADGTTDTFGGGSAIKSGNATVTTGAGSANSVSASVAAVAGAYAYAWFVGVAGSEKLAQITSINSAVFNSVPGAGQTAASLDGADHSTNALVFDGLMTFAANAGNGGYFFVQPTGTPGTGTPLTADGEGGIVEITAAFQFYWDNYRMSPDRIICGSQETNNIRKKVVANGGAPLLRLMQAADEAASGIVGGARVMGLMNPFTNSVVPLEIHPNAVAGTLVYEADTVPYPMNNVGATKEVVTRRDYYQFEWPLVSRKYTYGVYADEVLRVKVPFTLGMTTNIANG